MFELPTLTSGWQATLRGLDTRLKPGVLRPITFDARPPRGATTSSTCTSVTRSCRRRNGCCARSLWSVDSPLNRVTAVVVDDLPESFVAAVTRMVLVGRGGVRLHEEVFLAGVRLTGRRAMAEEKAEEATRRRARRRPPRVRRPRVRDELCDIVERARRTDCGPGLRNPCRLAPRGGTSWCMEQLDDRQAADTQRAHEIFAAFRANLRESLDRLRSKEAEAEAMLLADDQQKQWRRDIEAMQRRLDELDDEEAARSSRSPTATPKSSRTPPPPQSCSRSPATTPTEVALMAPAHTDGAAQLPMRRSCTGSGSSSSTPTARSWRSPR